jgi:hypothetical protein
MPIKECKKIAQGNSDPAALAILPSYAGGERTTRKNAEEEIL